VKKKTTGHFWEARYKAQPLLDETAITACLAYVDLNPIRAGLAVSPETSEFTSVKERISDRQEVPTLASAETRAQGVEHGEKAGWLAPIELHPERKKVREQATTRRASNKGCLPMTLEEYLRLLDWTGRQLRRDKVGRIPVEFAPILDRLDCIAESWLDLVRNFRKRFRTEAGHAVTLQNVSSIRRACRHANSSA
jgi:hypothetical protein